MRLIDHLKALGMSNRESRGAMSTGKVWVDGIPMADGGRVIDPAKVKVRPSSPSIHVGRDLVVLWRDDHMAVLYKPARMLSVPAPKRKSETNVLAEAGGILGTVYPVHRLDHGTSGLMMVARSPSVQTDLKDLLEVHKVERRYLAIVKRPLPKPGMTIKTTLVRNRGDGKRGSGEEGAEGGKYAVTHLRMVQDLGVAALVEARLESGRTHQVRIHLDEQGCPVLGDALYGGPSIAQRAPRLALHATSLGLVHPVTKEKLQFEAPLADDLEQLRRQLLEMRPRKGKGSGPSPGGSRGKSGKPSKGKKTKKKRR